MMSLDEGWGLNCETEGEADEEGEEEEGGGNPGRVVRGWTGMGMVFEFGSNLL